MRVRKAAVRPDGSSDNLPQGVYDMAGADAPALTPDQMAKVEHALKQAGADFKQTVARFRIEVFFRGGPRRTVTTRGVVTIWTNGGYLHGGGDAAVYLCPQVVNGKACMAPIDMQFVHSRPSDKPGKLEQVVVCTACRKVNRTLDLTGQILYEATTQRWADILEQLFRLLEHNADIAINLDRESIRRATEKEVGKPGGGEHYARVASKRECIVYPLAHILSDTASGAALNERLRAFLEA